MEVHRGIDVTSTKNPEDLVFSSTETDTLFILTSNLEEYEVQKITTQIKEDTIRIAESGEEAVRRWIRVSVVVEAESGVKKLRKFFWIPDGVVLDNIKTEFNEEESVLRILMPKSVRGVRGVGVEEVKEEEIGGERHIIRTGPVPDKVPETENPRKNEQEMEQGKKDVKETDEVVGRTRPVPDKVPEREIPRKNEQEMKEGKEDVPQHEPEQVKEALGVTITHPEEEPTHQLNKREVASTQETPAKEDADLEAKSRAAEENSDSPETAESTKVEADQVTSLAQFEEYNAQAQLKPEQEYDQTESLKPDHPEEVELGIGNEVPAEPPEEKVDNRKGSLAPSKMSKLYSRCLFAGCAVLYLVFFFLSFSC